ncbi:MAG: hypothetical protein KGJ02_03225 [Verrucomicrobiota bacterium]|nr:hypothetical protein [Verrucomicrobiota bacterium]
MTIETIVDKQLTAYNAKDFETFASCYHKEIVSYHLESSLPDPKMSGTSFFDHYRKKFKENPNLNCRVTKRILHDNLIVDQEWISGYQGQDHTEMVIYQIENGLITKMWFRKEKPVPK